MHRHRTSHEASVMRRIAVGSLGVGVAASGVEWWWQQDVVLTGVIAAATVAYAGFTWRLVRSAEDERDERHRLEQKAVHEIWLAVLTELEQNMVRKGQTHAWHTHVPFAHEALDASRAVRTQLSDDFRHALHEVEARIARFNAVARYNELRIAVGTGVADSELNRLAGEAHISIEGAVDRLREFVLSLAP